MKKTFSVERYSEISVNLTDKNFEYMSSKEYLEEFSSMFFQVDSLDDVLRYIVRSIDTDWWGKQYIEGVGYVDQTHPSGDEDLELTATYTVILEDVDVNSVE
jgi:hypothetical protein